MQPAGAGLRVAGLDDLGIGIDHRDGDGLGVPFRLRPEGGLLGQTGAGDLAQVVEHAVAAADGLADVAHARALLEDDVAAGQGDQGGDPERPLVDISDGLHVRDLGEDVGDPVAGGLGAAGAVDLEDEEVLLLLAGVFDFSRQERDGDVIEQPFELDPFGADGLRPRSGRRRRNGRRADR